METIGPGVRAFGYPLQPIPWSPLFRGLGQDAMTTLQQLHGPTCRVERDAHLIQALDPAPPLITVVRGWAFRYVSLTDGRRQILSFALPGDTIGLDALLGGAPVRAVQAAAPLIYAQVSHDRLARLLRDVSWFYDRAVEALARERGEAERALTRMGQCKADERVAAVLIDFYNRLAANGLAAADEFMLDITQQHLADYVGLTVVHLNRTLTRLRSRGLISLSGHTVKLIDVSGLKLSAHLSRSDY
jgi:CRP/FNR family transcriptional regulator